MEKSAPTSAPCESGAGMSAAPPDALDLGQGEFGRRFPAVFSRGGAPLACAVGVSLCVVFLTAALQPVASTSTDTPTYIAPLDLTPVPAPVSSPTVIGEKVAALAPSASVSAPPVIEEEIAILAPPAPVSAPVIIEEKTAALTPSAPASAPAFTPAVIEKKIASLTPHLPIEESEQSKTPPRPKLGAPHTHPLAPVVRIAQVRQGTGMMATLLEADIPPEDAHAVIAAMDAHVDLRRIPAGQELALFFPPPTASPAELPPLEAVLLELRGGNFARATRMGDGDWHGEKRAHTLQERESYAGHIIETSLSAAAQEAGLPVSVAHEFIRIYSHLVDFQRDIRKGDRFEVLFAQDYDPHGQLADTRARLLYLALSAGGKQMRLWRHEDPESGVVDYFDAEGRSMRRLLMRTPIDGARLSSGFGMRQHPILGYTRMHRGLDFAAPAGTPIYASGHGVIERIGRDSGYGKFIRLRHANGYETLYAHMSGYARGMQRGARVEQGQTIGYVGSTGLSTGPHLHYEVHYRGESMNPHSLDIPLGRVLEGAEMDMFQKARADMMERATQTAAAGSGRVYR